MAELTYPSTRYDPTSLIDLNSKAERERLSQPALEAFFNMMACWSIRDEDARALLGGITNGPYYKLKGGSAKLLDTDTLTRISLLIGIFKSLNILYGQKLADEWVRLSNSNRLFAGLSPLAYMIRGGIPALQSVRRLLDARRGGI